MNPVSLQYSLLRFQPDASRQEVVNIGAVLFTPDGAKTLVARNLAKVLALDPNTSLMRVQAMASNLAMAIDAFGRSGLSPAQICEQLGHARSGITLMPPGDLLVQGRSAEDLLAEIERDLVNTPARRKVVAPRVSRLHTELRASFRSARILGSEPGDISRHLVVPNFPIDPDVGLFAEFALRNGRLHVMETVDFRVKDHAGKKREAEAKTLVLLQALESVGAADLRRYVVVSGADAASANPSMTLLSRHADDVIVRESHEDWTRFVNLMAEAARHQDQTAPLPQ